MHNSRCSIDCVLMSLWIFIIILATMPAGAQQAADRLVSNDAELRCRKATSWNDGASKMLLLETNVTVSVGAYGFRADRAVIRIDQQNNARHIKLYLLNARSLPGRGPTSAQAQELLVTTLTSGHVDLLADLLEEQSAADDPFVVKATERFSKYEQALQGAAASTAGAPMTMRLARRKQQQVDVLLGDVLPDVPVVEAMTDGQGAALSPRPAGSKRRATGGRILPTDGVISYRADKSIFRANDKPKSLVLIGHVRVIYHGSKNRPGITLSADNAVVFIGGQGAEMSADSLSAGSVEGVYLEDNVVASDGDYTIRSPRVYYDMKTNKAALLDAVLYTWDVDRQIPIYVRAQKLMQQSRTSWQANEATLTTSEFAQPHFSIGAKQVTITQQPGKDGNPEYRFRSIDNTARVGNTPVFYWPSAGGRIDETPIRRFDVAYSNNDGATVRTSWDVYALFGKEKPEDTDLFAHLDYLGERGPAIGLNLEYGNQLTSEKYGQFDSYLLFADNGEDTLADRTDIDADGDMRGYLRWQHRQQLDDGWELSIEAAYVSDETFLEEFFRSEAETAKPYETSIYLKKQENDWAFTFLASYDLNDFVAQTTNLQAPGFNIDKMPEVGYNRIGTTLWNDRLTWYSENAITHMRVRPGEDDPADRGFSALQSAALFGIPAATTTFETALVGRGFEDGYVTRLDSRQELQMPTQVSIFDVVPYIVGRLTVWSDDTLDTASGVTTSNADDYRLWGAVGVRVHTELSKTYDNVSSTLFDVHRLRHIIEPSLDISFSDASVNRSELSIFENDVEGINQGLMTKFGLRNTLQTQRGGPGRWRTVDWIVLDTDLVLMNDEEAHTMQVSQYFGYRPEFARGDDHFNTRLLWMVSDTLGMVAELTQDLEANNTSQWRIGATMQHAPSLVTYVDFASIHEYNSKDLSYGLDYQLTSKYRLGLSQTVNLERTDDRSIELTLTRQLPRWKLVLLAEIDELDDEQIIGIVLVPDGLGGSKYRRPTFRSPHFD